MYIICREGKPGTGAGFPSQVEDLLVLSESE